MNCSDVSALHAALADGEVDGLRGYAMRRHIQGCKACAERLNVTLSLQSQLRNELSRHAAPAALRQRVAAQLTELGPKQPASRQTGAWGNAMPWSAGLAGGMPWRAGLAGMMPWSAGLAGAVAGAVLASTAWLALPALTAGTAAQDLPVRLVNLHTRASLSHREIAVASSDRHTVKPWLSARLDYSPPVVDAAGAGFALLGARLERLDGQDVAVLVYQHRQHRIDVLVRPEAHAALGLAATVRGFNVVSASGADMQWLAVSDLNGAELAVFLHRLAAGQFQD